MRMLIVIAASAAALSLAACNSPADKQAEAQSDAIVDTADAKADAIEHRADAVEAADTPAAEAKADSMDAQADAVRDTADAKADAVEQAAGKKD